MIDLQFEDDIRRVSRGEAKVMLAKVPYRYFRVLCAAAGRMVKTSDLLVEVYGPDHNKSLPLARVTIRKIRQKVAPLGIEIVAHRALGFGIREVRK